MTRSVKMRLQHSSREALMETSITWTSKDVAVAEDWNPTVNGLIHVTLYRYPPPGLRQVCVRGDDDTIMALDTHDDAFAERMFRRVNHLVTQSDLLSWGFRFE